MNDIRQEVQRWLKSGESIALATVAETWGSSPRKAGARMALTKSGQVAGSVSSGCVESAVVEAAKECFQEGRARVVQYGVTDDDAWQVGLSCGGKLTVLIEPLQEHWWAEADELMDKNIPFANVVFLSDDAGGTAGLISSEQVRWFRSESMSTVHQGALVEVARRALASAQSEVMDVAGCRALIDVWRPQPKLIMVGGTHVAVALQHLASRVGFRVFLVDPRTAFATPERFPAVEKTYFQYPDECMGELGLDTETYVAVLTHDPKIDDPALVSALPSPAPYVGVLSSRRTHQKRLARLRKRQIPEALLDRIHTPIGLKIGARSPEEIALAVLAEIISVRNGAA